MLEQSIKETIQQGYRQFLKSRDLKPRLGQKQMIAAIANSLGHSDADKRLGVIEAGTGTGKTVGYLLSALPIARAKEKTVVVATGTIALQEQLILKDIPDLLEASGWNHQVALVKGRGRYVCNMRLEQCLDAIKSKEAGLFLFEDEMPFNPNAQSEALYQELSESLENNSWDGDRDAWDTRIPDTDWQTLTVDHRQCTGRRCQFVDQCPFFKARAELEEADCIVANHDLVMADLALGGGAILPPPEDCIYIFDEGHRLGETAVKHFGAQCRINTTLNWLERVPKQLKGQTPVFEKDKTIIDMLPRIDSGANEIVALLTTCYPQFQAYLDNLEDDRQLYRFPQGDVGEGTRELAQNISALTSRWIGRVELLRDTLNEALTDRDYAVPIPDIELFYQQVGSWLTKGENLLALWDRLKQQLTSHAVPLACWLRLDDSGSGNLDIAINASPIQATEILREQLWGSCYGAVITSATLRSLGNFNTLKRETGIPDSAQFLSVAGAFNYAEAATLSVPKDCVEGNAIYEHTDYITDNLAHMVEKKAGTLVLFSSRRQMDEVFDRLDTDLQKICLVQGKYSNREMVRLHKERVDQGKTSVLVGLASFAEGVDLPGDYCKHVIIAKLPFMVPDDPLHEALSEWIEDKGGNSFFDIALPIASLRLIQACGRLLRTESDTGTVTILDKRLITKRYGGQLIDALPPFRRQL
ncbi:MAG: ATP-dependent DNA helicase DinG [Cellvibrionales bacterium]|nr:ATP-dependent DNA helicase DinG [Cellvibrionales bacterium]